MFDVQLSFVGSMTALPSVMGVLTGQPLRMLHISRPLPPPCPSPAHVPSPSSPSSPHHLTISPLLYPLPPPPSSPFQQHQPFWVSSPSATSTPQKRQRQSSDYTDETRPLFSPSHADSDETRPLSPLSPRRSFSPELLVPQHAPFTTATQQLNFLPLTILSLLSLFCGGNLLCYEVVVQHQSCHLAEVAGLQTVFFKTTTNSKDLLSVFHTTQLQVVYVGSSYQAADIPSEVYCDQASPGLLLSTAAVSYPVYLFFIACTYSFNVLFLLVQVVVSLKALFLLNRFVSTKYKTVLR